jgi:hypothetical protein
LSAEIDNPLFSKGRQPTEAASANKNMAKVGEHNEL